MSIFSAVQSIDSAAVLAVQEHLRFPLLTGIMKIITLSGSAAMIWLVVTAALMYFPQYRRPALRALAALALAWCINQLLKEIIDRPRPFETMEYVKALISKPHGTSFPSGHSASSFGYAYALSRQKGGKCRLLYIWAVLIAFSRVYMGVHYPSDVIVGTVIGILGGMLALKLFGIYDSRKAGHGDRLR